jgi:hypothetical protein
MKKSVILSLLFAAIYLSSCKKEAMSPAIKQSTVTPKTVAVVSSASSNLTHEVVSPLLKGYLKIQLAENAVSTDEVIISFDPTAKAYYVPNEDARTFGGFGAVNLSSLSSDNVMLAINSLPFPTSSCNISLVVNAKTDGIYKLLLPDITDIPVIFQVWLKDNYKKDSLDFRDNPSYTFNLSKADTASYGSNRFTLVVRQNQGLQVHLLAFDAQKTTTGTQITWKTENEANYTTFTAQKSSDGGQTFASLSSLVSSGIANYSFTDNTTTPGTYQYRLMMKDLNGLISYSDMQTVNY